MNEPQSDAADPRDQVPARTTPTWEMELLVSGATVFGLMQLPPLLDATLFGAYNSAAPEVAVLMPPLWVYLKVGLLTLIATFVLHLVLRGYWVALVGLYSVYPRGIDWQKSRDKLGPHLFETSREAMGDMPAVIEAADNRATRVFGVGFGMATMMLMPVVYVFMALVLGGAYGALSGQRPDMLVVLFGVFAAGAIPFGVFYLLDRYRGARWPADSRAGRWLRGGFRFAGMFGFGRTSPLLVLFSSNEGGRRTATLLGLVTLLMMTLVGVQALSERLGWGIGHYAGLPRGVQTTANLMLPAHYDSQRGDHARLAPPPYITDPVVRGPYLRLFVPYLPLRLTPAMQRACPAALADASGDAGRARLDCLAGLYELRIDGQAVALHFDAAEDPRTGQRGMVAMLPVKGLPEGRHELTLLPPARAGAREGDEPPQPFRILFWR